MERRSAHSTANVVSESSLSRLSFFQTICFFRVYNISTHFPSFQCPCFSSTHTTACGKAEAEVINPSNGYREVTKLSEKKRRIPAILKRKSNISNEQGEGMVKYREGGRERQRQRKRGRERGEGCYVIIIREADVNDRTLYVEGSTYMFTHDYLTFGVV